MKRILKGLTKSGYGLKNILIKFGVAYVKNT